MTQDPNLSQFFKQYEAWKLHKALVDEVEVWNTPFSPSQLQKHFFGALAKANAYETIHYFPVIMRELIDVMCNPITEEHPKHAFGAMADALKR